MIFRKQVWDLLNYLLFRVRAIIIFYDEEYKYDIIKKAFEIRKEIHCTTYPVELYQIFQAVKSTQELGGCIAEVGVYNGGTAKMICYANDDDKKILLFDTFEGLPLAESGFEKGQYKSDMSEVEKYLDDKNVRLIKGLFPKSAKDFVTHKFCFVHLDTDLYQSTFDSLKFFWNKLVLGGIIIVHDYIGTFNVRMAVDNFLYSEDIRNVTLIELSGDQCMMIKKYD